MYELVSKDKNLAPKASMSRINKMRTTLYEAGRKKALGKATKVASKV